MCILQTKDLKKYYGAGENVVKALDGVDLSIEKGEFVSIVGSSGSGKSTLLHMLGGLDIPTSGTVTVDRTNLSSMTKDEQTIFRRRKIGFVFQNYNLLPLLNVYENIVLPIQLDGVKPDKNYINEILDILGLQSKKYAMPGQLSGGQQQRVAMARALATKPAIVLADEPTGNLDSKSGGEVMELLADIWREMGKTLIIITHDIRIAKMAERQCNIVDGVLTEVETI